MFRPKITALMSIVVLALTFVSCTSNESSEGAESFSEACEVAKSLQWGSYSDKKQAFAAYVKAVQSKAGVAAPSAISLQGLQGFEPMSARYALFEQAAKDAGIEDYACPELEQSLK